MSQSAQTSVFHTFEFYDSKHSKVLLGEMTRNAIKHVIQAIIIGFIFIVRFALLIKSCQFWLVLVLLNLILTFEISVCLAWLHCK